jgi:Glycosyltransferase family 87
MTQRLTFMQFLRQYLPYLMPSALLIYIVLETYQIDFRAYYLAGKLIGLGLDPYLNYVTQFPELYGPINAEDTASSGFIYPPFAALLFWPLGYLPYVTAKAVYSVLMLGALWALLWRLVQKQWFVVSGGAIALALLSFPVIGNFERGQVDLWVCGLTVWAFYDYQQTHRSTLPALLLGMACSIKIFPIVAVLYFLAKRQFRLVIKTAIAILLLITAPLLYFPTTVYQHYVQRILPNFFGQLQPLGAIDLHGQSIVNRIVMAIDGRKLLVTHDYVNGYMNPFLLNQPVLSMSIGLAALALLLYRLRREPPTHQFFAALNAIHICNPQTWIMGLVWYIPFFIYFFDRANSLGKFILILPLWMPPFTNSNGMLAYAIALAFSFPAVRNRLLLQSTAAINDPAAQLTDDLWA